MTLADLSLLVRYAPAKTFRVCQRVTVQVGFGVCLMLVSLFLPPERGSRVHQTGTVLCTLSLGWWAKHQGKRRTDEQGKPMRNPTLRMTPEEAQRIQRLLRK